jgi:hypothetical protein
VVYVVVLDAQELQAVDARLDVEQRLTKALSSSVRANEGSPQRALVCARSSNASQELAGGLDSVVHTLAWLGMVMRPHGNTVGAVDKSITIDPLRRCRLEVPLDGPDGLLFALPRDHGESFQQALSAGTVMALPIATRDAIVNVLRQRYGPLNALLDWLLAMAEPSPLNSAWAEDRSWQEQQDALGTLFRIADFPLSAIAAWQRPADRDAQEFQDANGRVLEVANVNATPIESRLGTDLIYYHEPTHSFTFVQYKRLSAESKSLYVDDRLLDQLGRLEKITRLSQEPRTPADWRLCSDPCFLKLAYWLRDQPNDPRQPANGMYLPVSYARMLLADDCTLGPRNGRIFSYDRIERYLITSQFAPLVQHGLAGTVGTTIEQLNDLVRQRVAQGNSVTAGVEHADESPRGRQSRHRSRGSRKKPARR